MRLARKQYGDKESVKAVQNHRRIQCLLLRLEEAGRLADCAGQCHSPLLNACSGDGQPARVGSGFAQLLDVLLDLLAKGVSLVDQVDLFVGQTDVFHFLLVSSG